MCGQRKGNNCVLLEGCFLFLAVFMINEKPLHFTGALIQMTHLLLVRVRWRMRSWFHDPLGACVITNKKIS